MQVFKQRVPQTNETALANGSEGLQLGEVLWTVLYVHAAQTDANGTGRDDDDAVALLAEAHGGLDDLGEGGNERLMTDSVDNRARS